MSVDFPRAWEIARTVPPGEHPHPKCSFRQTGGAILCDCDVLTQHPEYLDDVMQGSGGAVIPVAINPLGSTMPPEQEMPAEPMTELAAGAATQHELFMAWVNAGFTRDEALQLLSAFITANIRPGA